MQAIDSRWACIIEAVCATADLLFSKVPSLPRSILKPSFPLSPPKPIPPHSGARKPSPKKGNSPRKSPSKANNTDSARGESNPRQSGLENLPDPFDGAQRGNGGAQDELSPTRVALRTEEEQQAAARERAKKEATERRDARRMSLGQFICSVLYIGANYLFPKFVNATTSWSLYIHVHTQDSCWKYTNLNQQIVASLSPQKQLFIHGIWPNLLKMRPLRPKLPILRGANPRVQL
jgi:hypothetical protein